MVEDLVFIVSSTKETRTIVDLVEASVIEHGLEDVDDKMVVAVGDVPVLTRTMLLCSKVVKELKEIMQATGLG